MSAPAGCKPTATGRFDREDDILETIRQHLREARRNKAIGKMSIEFEFVRGGISKSWIGCQINYRFLENTSALEQK